MSFFKDNQNKKLEKFPTESMIRFYLQKLLTRMKLWKVE